VKLLKFRIKDNPINDAACNEIVSILIGAAFKVQTDICGDCFVITVSL
jgi:hypothetical protein